MSEPDLSMRIDAILGRLDDGNDDPPGGLLHAARTLVDLDDHDRGLSSQHFHARLKGELFAAPPMAIAAPSTPHKPVPPRPDSVRRKESRMNAPRVLAIAATLVLLLGGMGIAFEGSLHTSRDSEPSAIPAASFASPAPIDQTPARPSWTAAAPQDAGIESTNHLLAGGRIFRMFDAFQGSPYIQAIDAKTGAVLWENLIASEAGILVASDDVLVIAELYSTPQDPDPVHHLVGLDAQSGIQRWQVALAGPPAAATLMGDRVLVLGWNNTLDAVGIDDGQPIYSVDIGGNSQWPDGLPVELANAYYDPGRIATIGTTVAVVLADGSVAAIDGETGTGLWWMYRNLQGGADVFAVGNRLVVSSGGAYIAPPDGTVLPTIATPAPVDSPTCGTKLSVAPEGTNISELTPPDYGGTLYGVDPPTGLVAWSGTTELFIGLMSTAMKTSKDDLLLDTTIQYQGTTTPGTWCAVDVDTGVITPLTDPASIALGSFINDVNNGRIMETVAIFANGQFVAYPTMQPNDPNTSVFDLSPYLSGAFRWVEIYEGAIYVSMGDGTLMKVTT